MAPAIDVEAAAEAAEDLPTAEEVLAGRDEISITELFSEAFMAEYTDFDTFDEMVAASPSDASSAADLSLVPDGTWDEFVAETTVFADEEEMVLAVRDHWVAEQLGL
ncbi:hypothetical protein SAMN04487949_0006 [Halogranum gelatinilyticum]|uniref:Uncharacterized protein n=1 Tax=Halogranum gelatinilyticum TaxID=660521 RepID=A0A1H0AAL1_9EURY|nr:hypothetical protein [Halogranum gelatinilyticum]SDN30679.1 hypothetical protein SAMN04487949_0006 [Halogranum gelatinilyticum]